MATKKQKTGTDSTVTSKEQTAETENGKAATATTKKKSAVEAGEAPAPKPTAKKAGTATTSKTEASAGSSVTKVYGEVDASGATYFIQKGSVPEGQLQLVTDKGTAELTDRIPTYDQQFVTIVGEFGKKKKTDKFATFVVHNIASHDEIARRAFELSHDNPTSVEDNWFRAENELLNR